MTYQFDVSDSRFTSQPVLVEPERNGNGWIVLHNGTECDWFKFKSKATEYASQRAAAFNAKAYEVI